MIRSFARVLEALQVEDELIELRIKRGEVCAIYAIKDRRGRRRRVEVRLSPVLESTVLGFFTQNRLDALIADTYPRAVGES